MPIRLSMPRARSPATTSCPSWQMQVGGCWGGGGGGAGSVWEPGWGRSRGSRSCFLPIVAIAGGQQSQRPKATAAPRTARQQQQQRSPLLAAPCASSFTLCLPLPVPGAPAEAGFGGPLNAYELTKHLVEAGAAGGESFPAARCAAGWLCCCWGVAVNAAAVVLLPLIQPTQAAGSQPSSPFRNPPLPRAALPSAQPPCPCPALQSTLRTSCHPRRSAGTWAARCWCPPSRPCATWWQVGGRAGGWVDGRCRMWGC